MKRRREGWTLLKSGCGSKYIHRRVPMHEDTLGIAVRCPHIYLYKGVVEIYTISVNRLVSISIHQAYTRYRSATGRGATNLRIRRTSAAARGIGQGTTFASIITGRVTQIIAACRSSSVCNICLQLTQGCGMESGSQASYPVRKLTSDMKVAARFFKSWRMGMQPARSPHVTLHWTARNSQAYLELLMAPSSRCLPLRPRMRSSEASGSRCGRPGGARR